MGVALQLHVNLCFKRRKPKTSLTCRALQQLEKYQGKTVPVVGEVMSNNHIAESISSMTGAIVRCAFISTLNHHLCMSSRTPAAMCGCCHR